MLAYLILQRNFFLVMIDFLSMLYAKFIFFWVLEGKMFSFLR